MLLVLALVSFASTQASLNIKTKTVGDGQHGTARWITQKEIRETYRHIPYTPAIWRERKTRPSSGSQGLVVGCVTARKTMTALVDSGDVHCLMIGAAGVGKTANFLYPNLEYACASGMSFITSDTKGDLYRNYAGIAQKYYGYNISVIDLRNPAKSDGANMIAMVNRYIDLHAQEPDNLALKLKNRVMLFMDEFGTLPKIESAEMMFSAGRSRRISMIPIIQSFAQLDKNYGKEGARLPHERQQWLGSGERGIFKSEGSERSICQDRSRS